MRGLRLIQRCPVCLYAGSLVPAEVVAEAPPGPRGRHRVRCTSTRSWPRSEAADARGQDVARVHSGDPSLYGAIAEQIRRLDALGIAWTITPGVPAFAAAAAALGGELTLPDIAQSVVLTRTAVRASAMPEGEDLAAFAATGATLVHPPLDQQPRRHRAASSSPILGADMPVAVVYRATWPDQLILRGTLATIRDAGEGGRASRARR